MILLSPTDLIGHICMVYWPSARCLFLNSEYYPLGLCFVQRCSTLFFHLKQILLLPHIFFYQSPPYHLRLAYFNIYILLVSYLIKKVTTSPYILIIENAVMDEATCWRMCGCVCVYVCVTYILTIINDRWRYYGRVIGCSAIASLSRY